MAPELSEVEGMYICMPVNNLKLYKCLKYVKL